jgi:hypothetical protein
MHFKRSACVETFRGSSRKGVPRRPCLARGGFSPCSAASGLRVAATPRCGQRALASLHPARTQGKGDPRKLELES